MNALIAESCTVHFGLFALHATESCWARAKVNTARLSLVMAHGMGGENQRLRHEFALRVHGRQDLVGESALGGSLHGAAFGAVSCRR